mgnify:CR=1 FL=1
MSNGSGVLRLNRFSYQNARMGFDPASLGMITLAATSAAAGAASASAQKKSAEATRQAADANAATLRNEADLQKQTGMENAKRMQQDTTRQMGEARLDAAQSSLLREGSVPIREQALATRHEERPIPVQPRQHGAIHGPRQCKSPENLSNGHPALRIRPGREYPPQMVKRLTRHLHLNEDSRKFRRKRGSFLTPPLPGCPGRATSQNSLACLPHITGHKASTLPLTRASRASNSRFASSPPP